MGLGLGEERSPVVGSDLLGEVRVRNHRYLTGPLPPAPGPGEAVVGALRTWRTCKWRASEGESIDAVEGDMTATARTLTAEAAVPVTVIVPSVSVRVATSRADLV